MFHRQYLGCWSSRYPKNLDLYYLINIYSKYAWVIPLKNKKGITVTNAFQKSKVVQIASQIKYGETKAAKFTIDQSLHRNVFDI